VFAGPLTVEPHKGSIVPLSLWTVTLPDIASLDRYEGHPHAYRKVFTACDLGPTFYYLMNHPVESPPWESYYHGVRAGFEDWGFDLAHLDDALERSLAAAERDLDMDEEYETILADLEDTAEEMMSA
jgi:hypothetical protein